MHLRCWLDIILMHSWFGFHIGTINVWWFLWNLSCFYEARTKDTFMYRLWWVSTRTYRYPNILDVFSECVYVLCTFAVFFLSLHFNLTVAFGCCFVGFGIGIGFGFGFGFPFDMIYSLFFLVQLFSFGLPSLILMSIAGVSANEQTCGTEKERAIEWR